MKNGVFPPYFEFLLWLNCQKQRKENTKCHVTLSAPTCTNAFGKAATHKKYFFFVLDMQLF